MEETFQYNNTAYSIIGECHVRSAMKWKETNLQDKQHRTWNFLFEPILQLETGGFIWKGQNKKEA